MFLYHASKRGGLEYMKTYIVYVNGVEAGYIKARNHNSAEKKAKNKHGTVNHDEIERYIRVNPTVSRDQAWDRLCTNVSVAYTEI